MAQYSMTTSTVQRSEGSCAVAHAAYVSGTRMVDARTGQEADYTRRGGVECVAPAIVVPAQERETQSASIEREALWNMAEAAEKRKDGTPARKVLIALPHELGPEARLAMTQEFAQWLADRYHVAVDFAIHKPDKQGDQRNYHAHIVQTTREIHDGELTDKAQIEWKGSRLKEAGLPSGKAMIHEMREKWEEIQNAYLTRHAPTAEKVSCKRLSVQRDEKLREAEALVQAGKEHEAQLAELEAAALDREPQRHVGYEATAMERRGVQTERAEDRREAQRQAKKQHSLVAELKHRLTQLWERGKAAIREVITAPTSEPKPMTAHELRAKRLMEHAAVIETGVLAKADRKTVADDLNVIFGKGRGEGLLKTWEGHVALVDVGAEQTFPAKGMIDVTLKRRQDGKFDYAVKPWKGKEKAMADLLRNEAAKPEPQRKPKEQSRVRERENEQGR